MFTSEPKELTDIARVFLEPANATHRQYEALRASSSMGSRRRGGSLFRLHTGQLLRPGPSVPSESPPPILPHTCQGTPIRP